MKILLAIDGSEHSVFAEQLLAKFPFALPPELQLVTVCPSDDLHALGPDVPPFVNTMVDQCRDAFTLLLTETTGRCQEWTESIDTHLLDGHAANEILNQIDRDKPDLVVLGSHGYGIAKRFLLGSVSDRVTSHSHCPVLITRQPDDHHAEINTILIGDDGSEQANAAVQRFANLPLGEKCTVILLAIHETIHIYGMDEVLLSSPEWAVQRKVAEKRLNQHAELFKQRTPNIKVLVEYSSSPADSLVSTAKVHSADLIVVGSTGKSGFSKFLLGSVSQRVLHHSPCSVWIERI